MKRVLLSVVLLSTVAACSGLIPQNTARIVSPCGPVQVASEPVVRTIHTSGPGISLNAVAGMGTQVQTDHATMTTTGTGTMTGQAQLGSTTASAELSSSGMSATFVDSETGETTTVNGDMPPGMAVAASGVIASANAIASVGVTLGGTTTTTVTGGEPIICGMSYESHEALLNSLHRDGNAYMVQLETIRSVAESNWITADQAVAILYSLGYDMNRQQAAEYMYPKICDPQNWFKVYDTIDSYVIRDEMMNKLGR